MRRNPANVRVLRYGPSMDFNDTDLVLDDLWASAHLLKTERKLIVCADPDCPPGLLTSAYTLANNVGINWLIEQYYDTDMARDVYVFGDANA